MPYEVRSSHPDCEDSKPYAVVKIGSGELMGCHVSRESALEQVAALYANEPEADDTEAGLEFSTVIIIEGERTSDGREIAANALTWRTLPLPLMMLKSDSAGNGHEGSVIAGRIERIWRDGAEIRGEGRFANSEEGREAADLVRDQMLRWVSADMEIESYEVIMEGCDDVDSGLEALFDPDCLQIMHVLKGRLAGATMVAFPAFPAAVIVPKEAMIPMGSDTGRPATAAATIDTGTNTISVTMPFVSDAPWDGAASRFSDDQWKRAAAACEGKSDAPKTDCYLPHHEPGGAVSRAGVHAAAARFNQTQRANKDRARGHLAGHYRTDLKEDVPDVLKASVVLAHAARFPVEPPAEWFDDPGLTEPTPLTITDEGRIFGSLASWDTCHIGMGPGCVSPPRGSNYSYFRTGSVQCPQGCQITTGTITLVGGHADTLLGWRESQQHYDETKAGVADVAIGEDEHGIWFAGAMRPHVTDEQVRILRASGVSGDWRPIAGRMELIGICAVNHPGFPIHRSLAASSRIVGVDDGHVTALIASGVAPEEPLLRRIRTLEARLMAVEAIAQPLRSEAADRFMAAIENGSGRSSREESTP